jgi:hypothetical protein
VGHFIIKPFDANGRDGSLVLGIREPCNKLIHAETVRFDVEEVGVQKYSNPTIYLYGTLNGKSWRAQLDVIKFCKAYITIVCTF